MKRSIHPKRGKGCILNRSFAIKGYICHTPEPGRLEIREDAFVVCGEGKCRGIFDTLPPAYTGTEVIDCTGKLVIPGLVDLHIHAPQFTYRGTGMDYELLEWLQEIAFPEEARYGDPEYAAAAYGIFSRKMKHSATTRAVIFGTMHTDATLILADCMEKSGLVSYVGKVSMDRAPDSLREKDADSAAEAARTFIRECGRRGFRRTRPIVTPRFIPSCTSPLLRALGEIRREYGLPVQSHLSENPKEIKQVRELEPASAFYGDAYDRYGLFGREGRTVMAHCVWSTPEETERIRENGVWVAHCPSSNMNIASGIAPVRRYLEAGIRVGLGTDVAGGTSESMFRAVTDAIQVSKLYWRHVDRGARPLTFPESLYLATKGGGSFFGKAGSFEEGYEFDALVLDDSVEPAARQLSVRDRLERAFYLGIDRQGIIMKFADSERVL